LREGARGQGRECERAGEGGIREGEEGWELGRGRWEWGGKSCGGGGGGGDRGVGSLFSPNTSIFLNNKVRGVGKGKSESENAERGKRLVTRSFSKKGGKLLRGLSGHWGRGGEKKKGIERRRGNRSGKNLEKKKSSGGGSVYDGLY